jgi:hypothetical protein
MIYFCPGNSIIRAFIARTYPKKEKIYLDEKEFKINN